jgi:hypothetical protein
VTATKWAERREPMAIEMIERVVESDPFALTDGDRETVKPAVRVFEQAWFDAPARRSSRPPRSSPSTPPIGDAFADDWFR